MTTNIRPIYDIKILVVDDELSSTTAFAQVFGELYQILKADSAQEGFKVLEQNPDIAVVVSDQRMPRVSGVEFLFHVKNTYPAISRVLLTGYADLDAAINAINTGTVFKYIPKPFEPDKTKALLMDAVSYHFQMLQNLRLKEEMQKLLQEKTSRAMENYTAWVAHHINNAMQSVQTFMDLAIPLFNKDQSQKEFAQLARSYVRRISDIITHLKEIYTHGLESFVKCPLSSLIEFENKEISKAIQDKKIVIMKEAKDLELQIMADPMSIQEAIRKLVANAVEASPAGAEIEIMASRDDGKNYVMFQVKDHGAGIPLDIKDKIFFPFLKRENSDKLRGLGLPYVQAVVARHGGEIKIDSTIGKGTTVIFKLPIIQPEKEETPLDQRAREILKRNKK